MNIRLHRRTVYPLLAAFALALTLAAGRPPRARRYLVVWAMEAQHPHAKFSVRPGGTVPLGLGRDFLTVYAIPTGDAPFGRPVGRIEGGAAAFVHHTNYTMPPDQVLYANDWLGDHTYVFDLRDPRRPRQLRQFGSVSGYGWPHSFQYLPNGNTLATFQFSGGYNHATGGLVEFAPDGRVVRTGSAKSAGYPNIRPYSLAVAPALDRVVTGSAGMAAGSLPSRVVQIWRLSDLQLLHTLVLPAGVVDAYEPRMLADGKTVVVPTAASCDLYAVRGLAGGHPSLEHIFHFPGTGCGVPAIAGPYYLLPSISDQAVWSLDLSDPAHPRLAGQAKLPAGDKPHWVSAEPGGDRVAITGFGNMITRVLFATINPRTGALRLTPEALDMGQAIPHAAIFSH